MNDKPAKEIIKAAYPRMLRSAFCNEVIADLRHVEDDFFAAVNETQQGVIAKRLAEDGLNSLSDLPSGAKEFTLCYLERNHGTELHHKIRALDLAAARIFLALPGIHSSRKRGSSGVFVILPRSCKALNVGRMSLRRAPDTFDYWNEVESEAEGLGPLDLFDQDKLTNLLKVSQPKTFDP